MSTDSIAWPSATAESRSFVDRLHEWIATADHKRLGILYIVYALLFLVIGGSKQQSSESSSSVHIRFRFAPSIQPDVHDARHHHDFLRLPCPRCSDSPTT